MILRRVGPAALVLVLAGSLAAADSGKTSREKASTKDKASSKDKASPKDKDKASSKAKGSPQKTAQDIQIEKSLLKATAKVQTEHLKGLEAVVSWAASNGLEAEAKGLVAKMKGVDPEYPGLAKVKAALEKIKPQEDAQKLEELRKTFSKKMEDANDQNGKRLFNLAASCMKVGLFTRAYDIVNQVLETDPDHKRARDVLSYAWDPASKTWITKWEADMRKKCFFTEEGWVKKEQKKKWDQGQREYLGKWLSKEEEERIRKRSDASPFSVESEHFEVKTNLGRKQAYEFAMILESYYAQFFRFFIGYYDQVAGAKLLFNQAKLARKHQVMLFPSRVEYLTFVKQEKGNNELARRSGGFYSPGDRECWFFWDGLERTLDVLYHEVAHQLFEETRTGVNRNSGQVWPVEGIATYMETWEKVDGKWKPGHRVTGNLKMAKDFLAGGTAFSLRAYLATEEQEFHKEPQRGRNYALGGALCHFFLHGQDEIYRESFVAFLRDYYSGTARGDSLFEYIEVEGASGPAKLPAIEKQFREHMASLTGTAKDAPTETEKPAEKEDEN